MIENDWWHVVPINDLREHIDSVECWCKPEVHEDKNIVVHNSMDGREKYETGECKPS